MWCQIRRILSWLLLLGTLVLLILMGFGAIAVSPAAASIRQLEEAPGQFLLQSRHSLPDSQGHAWQAIFFKRSYPDGSTRVNLRLAGFPEMAEIVHPQPLTLVTEAGEIFTASDAFAEQAPAANVGQYDLKPILARLPAAPATLSLVAKPDRFVQIAVPAEVILEWQLVSAN